MFSSLPFLAVKDPRLKNALVDKRNLEIFTRGTSAIDSNSSRSFRDKRVDFSTNKAPIQLPSRILGGIHPASTSSIELAALVVSAGTTRPVRRLKSLLLAESKKKKEMFVPYVSCPIAMKPVGGVYVPGV